MSVGPGKPEKPKERAEARRLRREVGHAEEADRGAARTSRREASTTGPRTSRSARGAASATSPICQRGRQAKAWGEMNRERRRRLQAREDGTRAARRVRCTCAGCMLYWAEGAKDRNSLSLANSDLNMVRFFKDVPRRVLRAGPRRLLDEAQRVSGERPLSEEIEDHWLAHLDLPRSCLRKHVVDHFPTSSSGRKTNRLPYGVCSLTVLSKHASCPAHLRRDPGVRGLRGAAVARRAAEETSQAPQARSRFNGVTRDEARSRVRQARQGASRPRDASVLFRARVTMGVGGGEDRFGAVAGRADRAGDAGR